MSKGVTQTWNRFLEAIVPCFWFVCLCGLGSFMRVKLLRWNGCVPGNLGRVFAFLPGMSCSSPPLTRLNSASTAELGFPLAVPESGRPRVGQTRAE